MNICSYEYYKALLPKYKERYTYYKSLVPEFKKGSRSFDLWKTATRHDREYCEYVEVKAFEKMYLISLYIQRKSENLDFSQEVKLLDSYVLNILIARKMVLDANWKDKSELLFYDERLFVKDWSEKYVPENDKSVIYGAFDTQSFFTLLKMLRLVEKSERITSDTGLMGLIDTLYESFLA